MTIGVKETRDPAEQRLDCGLTQPFRQGDDAYAVGRGENAMPKSSGGSG